MTDEHGEYLLELNEAVKELNALSMMLDLKVDANQEFYIGGNTRHVCSANRNVIAGAPLFRSKDPLIALRTTLDEWKVIRPPDELHVSGRRKLWIVEDGWVDLGGVEE